MKTFEFEGKRYKAAPDIDVCRGCAFTDKPGACKAIERMAVSAGMPDCVEGFIYILAEEPKQSKIEKAKAALKAAMEALEELENGQ